MNITVIASSSKGNCYLVEHKGSRLLLEAGLPLEMIRRPLWKMGLDLAGLAGCLVSHEHGDHARGAPALMRAGVDCYFSPGTFQALGMPACEAHKNHGKTFWPPGQARQIGKFQVKSFRVYHDCTDPIGFSISIDGLHLVFATDTNSMEPYRFGDVTHFMLEANFSERILAERGPIHEDRVFLNHMGLNRLCSWLNLQDLSKLEEIIIMHLSDDNADEQETEERIRAIVPPRTKIRIAPAKGDQNGN